MKFNIDFTYNEPMFGKIEELHAVDAEEAKEKALEELEISYPEAIDIEIISVKEV